MSEYPLTPEQSCQVSEYQTLYEFDDTWKATRVVVKRMLSEDLISFCVTFAKSDETKTLEFIRADDPANIIELMDFERITVSEDLKTERDFCTIKVELFADSYSELWCDSVSLKI